MKLSWPYAVHWRHLSRRKIINKSIPLEFTLEGLDPPKFTMFSLQNGRASLQNEVNREYTTKRPVLDQTQGILD